MSPMRLQKTPRLPRPDAGLCPARQRVVCGGAAAPLEGRFLRRYLDGFVQVAPIYTAADAHGLPVAGLFHGLALREPPSLFASRVFRASPCRRHLDGALITLFTPSPLFPRSLIVLVWLVLIRADGWAAASAGACRASTCWARPRSARCARW